MKKRILTLVLSVAMLFSVAVTASAAAPELIFESSYNAETNLVSVSLYVNNALGLESADFNLGYDAAMYEFEDSVFVEIENGMSMGGNIAGTPGLCTCSLIFLEKCAETDLDSNGRLNIATYTFKPLTDEYDLNEFCFWVSSYYVDGSDIAKTIAAQGNAILREEKTDAVTMPSTTQGSKETTKQATEGVSGDVTTKWYVYLIAGVLAVGAIAGIAFVAIRSSHNENSEENGENADNGENTEE